MHTSPVVAAKMAAVVAHPRIVIPRPLTASPMIAGLPVMRMISNIKGGVEKPCTIPAKTRAYDVCQAFGWKHGLHARPSEAKGFYLLIAGFTVIAMCMNFFGFNDADERGPEHPTRIVVADDVEQPLARDLTELGREVDDGDHHREGDRCRPQKARPYPGASGRVRPDRRGVVIGRTGDQAQADSSADAARLTVLVLGL